MAFGLMAALFQAQRIGRGCDVDTSLYDVALSLLSYPATWFLSAGIQTERLPMSAHPSIVPFQFFATRDGHIAIACAKEKFFRRLVTTLDLEAELDLEKFADFGDRRDHREEVLRIIGDRFVQESTAYWIGCLRGVVPCAPVRSMQDALSSDDFRERKLLSEYDHPALGRVRTVGSPIRFNEEESGSIAGPGLDADRQAILSELGLSNDRIAELETRGAFGPR
jgi:crotonobetainyl-CoA:carnitine CoA-transferase CaiB-like acyl-CoA transferase